MSATMNGVVLCLLTCFMPRGTILTPSRSGTGRTSKFVRSLNAHTFIAAKPGLGAVSRAISHNTEFVPGCTQTKGRKPNQPWNKVPHSSHKPLFYMYCSLTNTAGLCHSGNLHMYYRIVRCHYWGHTYTFWKEQTFQYKRWNGLSNDDGKYMTDTCCIHLYISGYS